MAAARAKRRVIKQDQTHILTSGTTIRFEQPKSTRKTAAKTSKADHAVLVIQEANPVSGFVSFLKEYAIVGLAVGFAIATQVQAIVKQLITSFIDPLYALLFNGEKLSSKTFVLTWHDRTQSFAWGAFIYTMIDFLFVVAALYLLVKFFKLEDFDKKKEKEKGSK